MLGNLLENSADRLLKAALKAWTRSFLFQLRVCISCTLGKLTVKPVMIRLPYASAVGALLGLIVAPVVLVEVAGAFVVECVLLVPVLFGAPLGSPFMFPDIGFLA